MCLYAGRERIAANGQMAEWCRVLPNKPLGEAETEDHPHTFESCSDHKPLIDRGYKHK